MELSGYTAVIGLEVHAQLNSKSKIFCTDSAEYGGLPNTHISPVSLGLPGALPVLNSAAIEMALRLGYALGCTPTPVCHFNRKNYFYPDLPKGYQITQFDTPICREGQLTLRLKDGSTKQAGIFQLQLEEDAGKSFHDQDPFDTLIDLNRAGVGLIEIVGKPDLANAEEAMAYLQELRKLVRYLDICDGNMEEGSFRCDANISVMKTGAVEFGIRVEVKNMNSISNVGRAIQHEIQRQIAVLESGGKVLRETRNWDAGLGQTVAMRSKEQANDYRYFPEPDLLPFRVTEELWTRIAAQVPELPESRFKRYTQELELPEFDAGLLTETKEFSNYFEQLATLTRNPKASSNWMNGAVKTWMNEQARPITDYPIAPQTLAAVLTLIEQGTISHTAARDHLLPALLAKPDAEPAALAQQLGLVQNSNADELQVLVDNIIAANPAQVAAYKAGKTGLLGFFVGQVMKQSQGKADPKLLNTLMQQTLER
jgi:aspartyl-tRNA(Asn)/glutamyl-tRNA(Gln) amidotransferase subunit B